MGYKKTLSCGLGTRKRGTIAKGWARGSLLLDPRFVSLGGMGPSAASRCCYFSGKARNLDFYMEIQDLSFLALIEKV